MNCLLRVEQREDAAGIRAVHEGAFATTFEARLVDELRRKARPYLGLVGERDDRILAHALFTPVRAANDPDVRLLGLGPMAVLPEHQGKGVGTRLGRAALSAARDTGARAVFVLGHPAYYQRFGFEAADDHGLSCPWEVPEGAFMVQALSAGGLDGLEGLVRYHPAFEGDGIAFEARD